MKREISAYYDPHVFREVYLNGHEEPFNRFLLTGNETEPGRALEAFPTLHFSGRCSRATPSNPTTTTSRGDWSASSIPFRSFYISVELYVRVFENPDPAKMDEYGVETAFYRRDDPAIRVARARGRGKTVSPEEAAEALRVDANRSVYARALALGLDYLRYASAFWCQQTDVLEAQNA